MAFKIILIRDQRILAVELWEMSLESAHEHALNLLDKKNADSVEVRDESSVLFFEHPRHVPTRW
jgi:hypothetical protein